MDERSVIKSLDESVAQFNILNEWQLIDISMTYIKDLESKPTVATLVKFRAELINYDQKTYQAHHQSIVDLIFKINVYLNADIEECSQNG